MRFDANRLLQAAGGPAAALGVAFSMASLIILASGGNPLDSFRAMFAGAFGSPSATGETVVKAIPLTLAGLAVALGLRAGLFNIGAEGQLLVGGLAAAWAGFALRLPAAVHAVVCLCIGAAAGGLWGLLPGLLKARRGVHEVISTIMLNYVAFYLTHYLVTNQLKDANTMAPQTPPVADSAELGLLWTAGGVHWGLLVAALGVVAFGFLMWHSVAGYELRAVGLRAEAAQAAGISVGRTLVLAMVLSGGLAGLAGSVEVLGVHHKFLDQFSPGYGFDSIAVALLGGNTAIGTAFAGLFFGALKNGAVGMQLATDTPREIVTLIQAIVIILVGMKLVRRETPSVIHDS